MESSRILVSIQQPSCPRLSLQGTHNCLFHHRRYVVQCLSDNLNKRFEWSQHVLVAVYAYLKLHSCELIMFMSENTLWAVHFGLDHPNCMLMPGVIRLRICHQVVNTQQLASSHHLTKHRESQYLMTDIYHDVRSIAFQAWILTESCANGSQVSGFRFQI